MGRGMVYTVDSANKIVDEFETDWDEAIQFYYGKRTPDGNRYHLTPKGAPLPYPRRQRRYFRKLAVTGKEPQ